MPKNGNRPGKGAANSVGELCNAAESNPSPATAQAALCQPTPPPPRITGGSDPIEHTAGLLWLTIGAEGKFVQAGREFLESSHGLDQAAIVRAVAAHLVRTFSKNATIDEAERAVWRDVNRLFGWHDLAEIECGGRA
jgi:hypothetical protein